MFLARARRTLHIGFAGMVPLIAAVGIAFGLLLLVLQAGSERDARIEDCLKQFNSGPRVCVKHYQHPSYPDGDSGTNLAFRCGKSYTEAQVNQCAIR